MPYKVTWEPRGAYTRLTDVVTGNCLLQNINEICADPRFDMLRYHIIDCRNADHFDVRDEPRAPARHSTSATAARC